MARDYDFALTLLAVGLAILIGALFVAATVYTFFAARANPLWTETAGYAAYITSMNSYLFPMLVGLIVVLGLCIPRRIFTRRALLAASGAMLGATAILAGAGAWVSGSGVSGLTMAWRFLLGSAALIQLAVIVLTAIRSPRVRYLQEGFLLRMGSALLHLGFIVLVAVFVTGIGEGRQLEVFWVATGLIMLGMVVSFYSGEISGIQRRR